MLTADTITDEQIRELRREALLDPDGKRMPMSTCEAEVRLALCYTASANGPSPARQSARACCAEILNAREGLPDFAKRMG